MKKIKTCFFTVCALLSLTLAKAQTADEIITKHTDAIGGKDKLAQINSVYLESNTSVMGTDALTKTYVIKGKGYKSESDFNGQNFVNVVTDKGGWMINPYAGASEPTAIPDDEFKMNADEVYPVDPLWDYAAIGSKVELA